MSLSSTYPGTFGYFLKFSKIIKVFNDFQNSFKLIDLTPYFSIIEWVRYKHLKNFNHFSFISKFYI